MSKKKGRMLGYDLRRSEIIPRDLFPAGRIRFTLDTHRAKEAKDRREQMDTLVEKRAWDILHAIQQRTLDVAEVTLRLKRNGESEIEVVRQELATDRAGAVPTFAEERERYMVWYTKNRSPQGAADVRTRLQRIGKQPKLGPNGMPSGQLLDNVPIDKVDSLDLEHAIEQLTENHSYHETYRITVSGLFTWSVAQEAKRAKSTETNRRWNSNPARDVTSRDKKPRVTILTARQIKQLRSVAELYQLAYLLWFLYLGLRSGELRHLRFGEDLSMDDDWLLKVQKRDADPRCGCAKCKKAGWEPKSKRSHRSFHVPQTPGLLREIMMAYLKAYPVVNGDFVFRNPRTGGVWTARALEEDFKRLCERAGVKYGRKNDVTLHTLRHTCATNLLRAGVGMKHVADLIGDTVKTVDETYSHLTTRDLTEGVEAGITYLEDDMEEIVRTADRSAQDRKVA